MLDKTLLKTTILSKNNNIKCYCLFIGNAEQNKITINRDFCVKF